MKAGGKGLHALPKAIEKTKTGFGTGTEFRNAGETAAV
jgi:hypothetical protein